MLVQPDRDELGDKRLDGKENVARQRELALHDASVLKNQDQDELADVNRSIGRRMHYTEVLRRITNINPHLRVLDGSPGNVALYIRKTPSQLAEDEGMDKSPKGEFFDLHKYVGGMPKVELPEYGHVELDTSLIATKEHIRGWRTVLISLIKAKVLTYRQAVEAFGEANDRRSNIWARELHQYKI